jgi:type II secretory pathway component HofQ
MTTLKTDLREILSPQGRIVVDDATDFIMIYDFESKLAQFAEFLDPLALKSQELLDATAAQVDPLQVLEFRLTRDAGQAPLLTAVAAALSEEFRRTHGQSPRAC